jgi:hypothetical protein
LRRASASVAALVVIALALGSCGSSEPSEDSELTIYVSLPDSAEGREIVAASKQALADVGNTAGGVAVRAEYLEAPDDPVTIAENARQAVEDSTSIAYIGELDPKANLSSQPITGDAELLQVAPTEDAMAGVLDAIDSADDPLDRASVADAFRAGR